jgi:hypothetical protein
VIDRVVEAWRERRGQIASAAHDGGPGHPLVFARTCSIGLRASTVTRPRGRSWTRIPTGSMRSPSTGRPMSTRGRSTGRCCEAWARDREIGASAAKRAEPREIAEPPHARALTPLSTKRTILRSSAVNRRQQPLTDRPDRLHGVLLPSSLPVTARCRPSDERSRSVAAPGRRLSTPRPSSYSAGSRQQKWRTFSEGRQSRTRRHVQTASEVCCSSSGRTQR